jgi:hypothetical protein
MFNLFKSNVPSEETKQMVQGISDGFNRIKENEIKRAQEPIIDSCCESFGFANNLIIELRNHSLNVKRYALTQKEEMTMRVDELFVLKRFLDRNMNSKNNINKQQVNALFYDLLNKFETTCKMVIDQNDMMHPDSIKGNPEIIEKNIEEWKRKFSIAMGEVHHNGMD